MIRLVVSAAVVLGPVAAYLVLLGMRRWLQRRRSDRNRPKVSVAELATRLERERAAEADRTDRVRNRQPGLPQGWVWPSRDPDDNPPKPTPIRPRRYVRRAYERNTHGRTQVPLV